MGRKKRPWHPGFIAYMEWAISHENYRGLPIKSKRDGTPRWVEMGGDPIGRERLKWWDQKRKELGIPKEGKWPSITARANHPTGMKPCQICGRVLKIHYVYPTRTSIRRLNETFIQRQFIYDNLFEVSEIFRIVFEEFEEDETFEGLASAFSVPVDIPKEQDKFLDFILKNPVSRLSPGAKSNCPDRFDALTLATAHDCCPSPIHSFLTITSGITDSVRQ